MDTSPDQIPMNIKMIRDILCHPESGQNSRSIFNIAEKLIECGYNDDLVSAIRYHPSIVHLMSPDGYSLLSYAVLYDNPGAIRLIYEAGAHVSLVDLTHILDDPELRYFHPVIEMYLSHHLSSSTIELGVRNLAFQGYGPALNRIKRDYVYHHMWPYMVKAIEMYIADDLVLDMKSLTL